MIAIVVSPSDSAVPVLPSVVPTRSKIPQMHVYVAMRQYSVSGQLSNVKLQPTRRPYKSRISSSFDPVRDPITITSNLRPEIEVGAKHIEVIAA
jgi:hypothetical protein